MARSAQRQAAPSWVVSLPAHLPRQTSLQVSSRLAAFAVGAFTLDPCPKLSSPNCNALLHVYLKDGHGQDLPLLVVNKLA